MSPLPKAVTEYPRSLSSVGNRRGSTRTSFQMGRGGTGSGLLRLPKVPISCGDGVASRVHAQCDCLDAPAHVVDQLPHSPTLAADCRRDEVGVLDDLPNIRVRHVSRSFATPGSVRSTRRASQRDSWSERLSAHMISGRFSM